MVMVVVGGSRKGSSVKKEVKEGGLAEIAVVLDLVYAVKMNVESRFFV